MSRICIKKFLVFAGKFGSDLKKYQQNKQCNRLSAFYLEVKLMS